MKFAKPQVGRLGVLFFVVELFGVFIGLGFQGKSVANGIGAHQATSETKYPGKAAQLLEATRVRQLGQCKQYRLQ